MLRNLFKQLVILPFVLVSAVASAQTFTFDNITNNSAVDLGNQLTVDITDGGMGSVLFDFSNNVGIGSNVAEIYFDAGGFLASLNIQSQSAGVTFASGLTPPDLSPPNPPGINPFTTDFGFDIGNNNTGGLNESADSLVLNGVLSGVLTYLDLINAINSDNFEIALHVRSIEGAGASDSDSYLLNGPSEIPVPAAGWLFGTALIGLMGLRRRLH